MNNYEDIKSRITDKLSQIQKKMESLSSDDYLDLTHKLWEVERETALLREYIEKNISEDDYREVI